MRHLTRYVPLVFGLLLFAGWFVCLRPSALGGPVTYTMVSGTSMQPRLQGGDLLVMREQDAYRVGDIVSYHIPQGQPGEGNAVVHRLKGGNGAEGFITKGDNVARIDPWKPRDADIIGKLALQIPKVGFTLMLLHSPLAIGTLAGGVTAFMVMKRPERSAQSTPAAPVPVGAKNGSSQ